MPSKVEMMRKQVEASLLKQQRYKAAVLRSVKESSALSDELWNDSRCQHEVEGLVRLLLQPGVLELFAVHEAGHEIYYRRAGCTAFAFVSPRILHDEKNQDNPFTEQRAAIRIKTYVQPEGDNWLTELERGYAVGGRCSVGLTTTDNAGDTNDRKRWGELYVSQHPDTTLDDAKIEEIWLDAQDDVNKDLDDDDFKAQVRAKAHEIAPLLFP
jgi:hypothetical protein